MFFKKWLIKAVVCASVFFLPGIASADFINCGNCKKWINGNQWVPVSGMKIETFENGRLIGSGTTNANGEYNFRCFTPSTKKNNKMNERFSKRWNTTVFSMNYNWVHLGDLPLGSSFSTIINMIKNHTTNVGGWYPGR